jgi:N-acetylglutamate synthase-like GNAT family acetyltransferase
MNSGFAGGTGTLQIPDIEDVVSLLEEVNLPVADLNSPMLQHFLGAYMDSELIAVGGLEVHARHALLRSLATAPARRNQGFASQIVSALEHRARSAGVSDLYLLTETAQAFFASRGFALVPRDAAPSPIAGSPQFRELCPASAAFMHKRLVALSISLADGANRLPDR